MKQIEAKFIGVDHGEVRYGISKWTLRHMAYSGRIGSVKIGRRLLLSVDELDLLFAEGYRPALADQK